MKRLTKKRMLEECRRILHYDVDKNIEVKDQEFLKELILRHPEYKLKIGCGIKEFFRGQSDYGKYCFYIRRIDNSTTDFSFYRCIYNNIDYLFDIKKACRTAILPSISKIKKEKNEVIHHEGHTFNEIFNLWIKDKDIYELKINNTKDNDQQTYFINKNIENDFREFHDRLAILKKVSIIEHKLIHKKEVDKDGYTQ